MGEEGPELVNFTDPARVYTAAQTRRMAQSMRSPGPPPPVLTSAQLDTAHKALTQSVKGGLPERVYLMDEQGGLVTTARVVVRDEMAMQGVWS